MYILIPKLPKQNKDCMKDIFDIIFKRGNLGNSVYSVSTHYVEGYKWGFESHTCDFKISFSHFFSIDFEQFVLRLLSFVFLLCTWNNNRI